jgi:hypothetical protein
MMKYRCALCKATDKKLTTKYVSFDNEESFALSMCNDCWSYAMEQGVSDEDVATIKSELA